MVCADPDSALARFEALPQIVAVIEQRGRRARGLTVEGVPVELVVAAPERFGTELVRATGSAAYVAALEPLPDAPTEAGVYEALGLPWVPPELREAPFRGEPAGAVEEQDIRGDLHCHTTWSDGRFSVEEMGRAARERGYDYVAICDHTPAVGAVRGLTADDVRRQGEEIAAANERLAPFRILRGIECDILPDGRLDLPDDVLAELDWVQASVHGGQRMPRARADRGASRRRCATPPCAASAIRWAGSSAAGPENALDLERVFEVAREHDVALEVNGLAARLDLSGEHVREALRAGVRIVCSTDAHSVRGLANMPLSVHTARRGGATRADVLNTRPLEALLGASPHGICTRSAQLSHRPYLGSAGMDARHTVSLTAIGAGLAVGALSSIGRLRLDGTLDAFANSTSTWLVAPFLVGSLAASRRGAAAAGFATCAAQLVAYYIVDHVQEVGTTGSLVAFWTACALVGGPVFGLAGRLWRTSAEGTRRRGPRRRLRRRGSLRLLASAAPLPHGRAVDRDRRRTRAPVQPRADPQLRWLGLTIPLGVAGEAVLTSLRRLF